MDENDSLFEYNKIPLGHNRTNGAVYSKINLCCEKHNFYAHNVNYLKCCMKETTNVSLS